MLRCYRVGANVEQNSVRVFTRILAAIAAHVGRITYMPDPKLTLYYYCVSWCTHISHNTGSVKSVSGNRSCYWKTHSTDIVHTKADANIICYSVLHGTRIKLTRVAPIARSIKCQVARESLATIIVTHAIGKRTQAKGNIILLVLNGVPNYIHLNHVPGKCLSLNCNHFLRYR